MVGLQPLVTIMPVFQGVGVLVLEQRFQVFGDRIADNGAGGRL